MKKLVLIFLLIGGATAVAQDEAVTLDDFVDSAQQWAQENLDDETLRSLQSVDQEKVKQFLADAQKRFQGEYVIDLAQLRDAAKLLLPILESHEETAAYGAWLKARMDYLEVAEELRLRIPSPKSEPDQPAPIPEKPKPEMEREIWITKLSKQPRPAVSNPYVRKLKPVFVRHNLPAELVWLAEVESAFDPRAKSPVGAAGLFQLMPATAKQYGLKTWPFDQRYQPEESAGAAAKYLSYLYKRFGDWRLTFAAYNAGEGRVQRLLDRSRVKTFEAIAPSLPAETQMYVPKVEATLLRREGLQLSQLTRPTKSVESSR
jgi:membrane-bound lytic murein transglycosylase D